MTGSGNGTQEGRDPRSSLSSGGAPLTQAAAPRREDSQPGLRRARAPTGSPEQPPARSRRRTADGRQTDGRRSVSLLPCLSAKPPCVPGARGVGGGELGWRRPLPPGRRETERQRFGCGAWGQPLASGGKGYARGCTGRITGFIYEPKRKRFCRRFEYMIFLKHP